MIKRFLRSAAAPVLLIGGAFLVVNTLGYFASAIYVIVSLSIYGALLKWREITHDERSAHAPIQNNAHRRLKTPTEIEDEMREGELTAVVDAEKKKQ